MRSTLAASSGWPGSAWAQMPDNRGVKLNPEDSVPPAYLDTLDERDRVRLDAARQQGDSFVPIFSGRGQAPGYTQPAGGVGSPFPPGCRGGRVTPRPTYEAYSPAAARGPPARPARRPHIGSDRRAAAEPGARNRRGSSGIRYPAAKPETAAPATSGTPPEPSIHRRRVTVRNRITGPPALHRNLGRRPRDAAALHLRSAYNTAADGGRRSRRGPPDPAVLLPEDRISDLIGVLLQNWSKPPRIVRIRYPPAKPETAAPATSGTPPEPSIPLPPAGGGSMRARFMRSTRTIRDRC